MELIKTMQRFSTQDKCIKYLEQMRWHGKPRCPYCKSLKASSKKSENRYRCLDCNNSYSVLVGTVMEATKLPLQKWFLAICLMLHARKGLSSLQLSRDLGINKNTAWYLQKRIRTAMQEKDLLLHGVIEADESYIGGALNNKHKKYKNKKGYHKSGMEHKTPVLGMVQREGRIAVQVLGKAWGVEIKPILQAMINKESIVITDGFGGYKDIDQYFTKHIKVNKSRSIWRIGEYHTNTIEGFWSMFKRAIVGQYHKVSPKHLQNYLDEISFKYNYRNQKDKFNTLIINCLSTSNAFT